MYGWVFSGFLKSEKMGVIAAAQCMWGSWGARSGQKMLRVQDRQKKSVESAQFDSRHSEVSGEASTEEKRGERERDERHAILSW